MTDINCLPNELLAHIFTFCDLHTLYSTCRTCKRMKECVDSEIVWRSKWHEVCLASKHKYGEYTKSDGITHKSIVQRHKSTCEPLPQGYQCRRCKQATCTAKCMQTWEEAILFDFGAKTTWMKHIMGHLWKLSMHPTLVAHPKVPALLCESGKQIATVPECLFCIQKPFGLNQEEDRDLLDERPTSPKLVFESLNFEENNAGDEELAAGSGHEDMEINEEPQPDAVPAVIPVPPVPAIPNNPQGDAAHIVESPESHRSVSHMDELYAVSQHLNMHCPFLLRSPFRGGQINIQDLDFLVQHILKREGLWTAKWHHLPAIICVPNVCESALLHTLLQVFFERVNVPRVFLLPKAIAVSLNEGPDLDTCLVIDSGAYNTSVSPVIERQIQPSMVQHKHMGGFHIASRLAGYLNSKGLGIRVAVGSLDAERVKRECYLSTRLTGMRDRGIPPREIYVRIIGDDGQSSCDLHPVTLSHELYQAPEDMYLMLNLPEMVQQAIQGYPNTVQTQLLSRIVLTGGNCRLRNLPYRLTRDLELALPQFASYIHICNPSLITGRLDAVMGASYCKLLEKRSWITRENYVLYGPDLCIARSTQQLKT